MILDIFILLVWVFVFLGRMTPPLPLASFFWVFFCFLLSFFLLVEAFWRGEDFSWLTLSDDSSSWTEAEVFGLDFRFPFDSWAELNRFKRTFPAKLYGSR